MQKGKAMLKYNEITKEWEDSPIHFQIAGVDKTDDDYLVSIPAHYVPKFEGHNFPSLEIFKRALMFAGCANEARYYNRPWIVERDERCLEKCLEL